MSTVSSSESVSDGAMAMAVRVCARCQLAALKVSAPPPPSASRTASTPPTDRLGDATVTGPPGALLSATVYAALPPDSSRNIRGESSASGWAAVTAWARKPMYCEPRSLFGIGLNAALIN